VTGEWPVLTDIWTIQKFEQLEREQPDRRLELIDGQVVEVNTTEERGLILANLCAILREWSKQNNVGYALVSVHYAIPGDEYNVRMIDLSFVLKRRVWRTSGYATEFPDLAIHIRTYGQSDAVAAEKAQFYLRHGSKLAWVFQPDDRTVMVYRSASQITLIEADTLSGGDVLPGFALPVREVFADPMAE